MLLLFTSPWARIFPFLFHSVLFLPHSISPPPRRFAAFFLLNLLDMLYVQCKDLVHFTICVQKGRCAELSPEPIFISHCISFPFSPPRSPFRFSHSIFWAFHFEAGTWPFIDLVTPFSAAVSSGSLGLLLSFTLLAITFRFFMVCHPIILVTKHPGFCASAALFFIFSWSLSQPTDPSPSP